MIVYVRKRQGVYGLCGYIIDIAIWDRKSERNFYWKRTRENVNGVDFRFIVSQAEKDGFKMCSIKDYAQFGKLMRELMNYSSFNLVYVNEGKPLATIRKNPLFLPKHRLQKIYNASVGNIPTKPVDNILTKPVEVSTSTVAIIIFAVLATVFTGLYKVFTYAN